jgi:AbrB family looped-hinge helix DNA binding protein
MTLTTKGQVPIPQDIRNQLGLKPGTRVVSDVVGDSVRIRRAGEQGRGDALVAHLRAAGRRTAVDPPAASMLPPVGGRLLGVPGRRPRGCRLERLEP